MREGRLAAALCAGLVVAAFANVVFGGKSLVPSENQNPLDYRSTARNYGPGYVQPDEWRRRGLVLWPNYRDPAGALFQGDPSAEFLRRSLERGEFPFWDPYVGGGMPSFATLVPGYLFPPALLVVLSGNHSAVRNAYILLLVLASALLTYKLLRELGVSWHGAVTGGVALAFSGAVIQTVPSFFGQPVALFSLPLLLTVRLLAAPSPRRAAQAALGFAFVALATVPPILIQVFGTCALYAIVACCLAPRDRRMPALSWFTGAAAAALGLVAVAYIPALLAHAASPQVARYYERAAVAGLEPQQLAQLLSPTIAGGAAVYANPAIVGATNLHLYYTGAVALLLACTGVLARWQPASRALAITVALAGGLSLAKVFALPPVQWIAAVPGLRSVHFGAYFGILVAYSVALLAGLGVDALIARRARIWHVLAGAGAMAAALVAVRVAAHQAGVRFHPEGWRWIADFRLLAVFSLLAVAFSLMAVIAPRRGALFAGLLVGVLAIESLTNTVYPRQQRWELWRHPPEYVETLARLGTMGRVLPMPIYQANTPSVFGHPTLDSLTMFASPRVFELYRRYFNPATSQFLFGTRTIPPEGVLDAANIEYLVIISSYVQQRAEANGRGYQTVYEDDLMQVFRRRTTPRYWFTSTYGVAAPETILAALANAGDGSVWLEAPPAFASLPAPAAGSAAEARPTVMHFGLNEVELEIDAPRAGLVVCSESHMPGWSATVDGQPAEILRANYAFRAVEVPRGRHILRLRYRAPGLRLGFLVSAASLLACFILWRRSPGAPRFAG